MGETEEQRPRNFVKFIGVILPFFCFDEMGAEELPSIDTEKMSGMTVDEITNMFVCADDWRVMPCYGDEGIPLFTNETIYKVLGIVLSRYEKNSCQLNHLPIFYLRVSHYKK